MEEEQIPLSYGEVAFRIPVKWLIMCDKLCSIKTKSINQQNSNNFTVFTD